MLLIDTYLDRSPIQGIGLFAKRFIPRGAMVWELRPAYDRLIAVEQWESETGAVKDYLDRYAYPSRSHPGFILFEADDARYMNHADDPNCDVSDEARHVALRDIEPGEELTCDYRAFFPEGFEMLGDR